MIGSYIPLTLKRRAVTRRADPFLQHLRLELRRGCLVLAVLAELRTERYGYALRKALARRGIPIEAGTLYPLLRRLYSQGLLQSEWQTDGRRGKRVYRLTPQGGEVLDHLLAEWNGISASLDELLDAPHHEAA